MSISKIKIIIMKLISKLKQSNLLKFALIFIIVQFCNNVNANNCKDLIKEIQLNNIVKVKELLKSVNPNCINPKPEYETFIVKGDEIQRRLPKTPFVMAAY